MDASNMNSRWNGMAIIMQKSSIPSGRVEVNHQPMVYSRFKRSYAISRSSALALALCFYIAQRWFLRWTSIVNNIFSEKWNNHSRRRMHVLIIMLTRYGQICHQGPLREKSLRVAEDQGLFTASICFRHRRRYLVIKDI